MRNVTKQTDAAGQLTDEGRDARPSEVDKPVRSVESAERIVRLLKSKRSISELKDQKGECVTPCDEQSCEQESSQAGQMDKGEIEVEVERRVRVKRVPVFPTDKEKDENEIMHMTVFTKRVASATSDHGSWIPCPRRVHSPVLIQKIHSTMETCHAPHESPQTRAVFGVLENLDTCGLGEVLLKRDGVCHSDTRRPSKGRTRRKDDGREVFEVFAAVEWHERECYEKRRNISDNRRLRVARMVRMQN